MDYEETLEYIHSVKWQVSKPGLSRTKELLKALGNPEKKLKFVHIAGTDGKGSTAACISAVLKEAGYKTGLYTSPYINKFNERMQINGKMIDDAVLVHLTEKIRPTAEKMKDLPTEFEMITAIAMEYFWENSCDIVVLETGLGGELDSTNVIDTPLVAVITSLGMDHVRELGPSISDIAGAKAGIIKRDGRVVFYGMCPEGERVIRERCREKNASLDVVDFSLLSIREINVRGSTFDFDGYKGIKLPLAGTYQPYNAALAVRALEKLRDWGFRIENRHIYSGLSKVKWPGRFELIGENPLFILDGAHNPHGMAAACDSIKNLLEDRKVVLLTGVMADKDVGTMMELASHVAKAFVTVTPNNPRAMKAEVLADILKKYSDAVYACSDIGEGVSTAVKEAGKDGAVCAVGSLYFSADVRKAYMDYCKDESVGI